MENDEERAETFFRLVSIHRNADKFFDEGCTRISGKFDKLNARKLIIEFSVNYKDHSYVICLSNKKIHIVKKSVSLVNDDDSFVVSTNIPVNNSINS